jgi:hypothetical protein
VGIAREEEITPCRVRTGGWAKKTFQSLKEVGIAREEEDSAT